MKKRVGVVADDITGANDIGIMFAKNGYATGVFPFSSADPTDFENLDVVILDTDSRFDSAGTAAQKVKAAALLLKQTGFDCYFKKTCSVFRGNIGAEFDAMQDILGADCSMVIAGFPKNGRTTREGIHYLNGKPLDQSALVCDPVHPTTEPALAKIIGKQSDRVCGLFSCRELDLPFAEQCRIFNQKKQACSYLIFDVRNQEDLVRISKLVKSESSLCGSSAIGEELPKVWGIPPEDTGLSGQVHPVKDPCGTLVLAGSLTAQTVVQIEYLQKSGTASREIDTVALFDSGMRDTMLEDRVQFAVPLLKSGKTVLLYTENQPEAVAKTKKIGHEKGLTDEEIGRVVSAAVHDLAVKIQSQTGLKKLVVAGGDTSAAVSSAFSLRKMIILKEIEPGVPTMYGYGRAGELLLVFKSGSFGSASFLQKAVDCLLALQKGELE